MKLLLYEEYAWLTTIGQKIINLLPPIIRRLVWKIILGSYGWGMIDRNVYFRYPWKIHIGKKCAINRGCAFYASVHTPDKYNIVIGNHVAFGPNVTIFTAGHDPTTLTLDDTYGRVVIEDDVWIGGNTTILQGVTIHKGAVVGAGSVVTRNIPPYTIYVGVPAREVKKREIRDTK